MPTAVVVAGVAEQGWAADAFFMGPDAECDYSGLPEPFSSILDDMAMQLHDTVSSPAVALNFSSTPEQLLERLHAGGPGRRVT